MPGSGDKGPNCVVCCKEMDAEVQVEVRQAISAPFEAVRLTLGQRVSPHLRKKLRAERAPASVTRPQNGAIFDAANLR